MTQPDANPKAPEYGFHYPWASATTIPPMESDAPSISTPSRIVDHAAYIAAVNEDAWPLTALGDPARRRPSKIWFVENTRATNLKEPLPDVYRATAKRYAWLLLNVPTPDALLNAENSKLSEWYPANAISGKMRKLRGLLSWLARQGITSLSWCTPDLLDEYNRHIFRTRTPRTGSLILHEVWLFSRWAQLLPPDDRLCTPNWSGIDTTNQIPVAQAGSAKPSIQPETIDPLLNWSLAMLNDIQHDIFAGLEEVQSGGGHQSYGTTDPHQWLASYLDSTHSKVPTVPGQPNKTALSYLSYLSGITAGRINDALRRPGSSWVRDSSMPTPISTPVTARVAGQPWAGYIDYYDLAATGQTHPPLVRHLQSAAALTVCYLTGCRAEEVYTLRRDCLEEMPPTAEGMTGFFLNGTLWKKKGVPVPVKWPAAAPVADAVRVLERIAGEDAVWLISKVQGDRAKTDTVVRNLREFVEYCRGLTKSLPNPAGLEISKDPEGGLTYERLRRTIGFAYWRQPDGDFVTGIQFKHTQAILGTQGYASYAALPTGAILRNEERQAQMDLLNDVAATLTAGTRVSGPASDRLVEAAIRVKATLVSGRESKQLLSDPDLRIFANPSQMSLCVYKASTAMCAGPDTEPDRGACVASCGNHARTEVQIEEMRSDGERLAREAASPLTPVPLADRLRGRAGLLEKRVQDHEETARAIKLEDEG